MWRSKFGLERTQRSKGNICGKMKFRYSRSTGPNVTEHRLRSVVPRRKGDSKKFILDTLRENPSIKTSEIAQMAEYTAGYVRKVLNAGAAPSEPRPGGVGGPAAHSGCRRLRQATHAGCRRPRRVLARRRRRAAYAGCCHPRRVRARRRQAAHAGCRSTCATLVGCWVPSLMLSGLTGYFKYQEVSLGVTH